MAATHLVLGKGPIGSTLAARLAAEGSRVVVVSRSGGPGSRSSATAAIPLPAGVEHVAGDVTDPEALTALADGMQTITCCVNPPYHRWAEQWPPIVDSLIAAASRTGAVAVLTGNLYAYGPAHRHMTEDTPLDATETKGRVRAEVWSRLRAAHKRGDLRAVEVRGSDYLGPGAGPQAHAGDRLTSPLLTGRTIRPIGSADQPHTWTYLPDFAHALAVAGSLEAAWGRAWHVPSPEPLTFRELARRLADAAGVRPPRISPVPVGLLRVLGPVAPMLRELAGVSYQFTAPFVVDSALSQQVLGVTPTPWDEIAFGTVAAARADRG